MAEGAIWAQGIKYVKIRKLIEDDNDRLELEFLRRKVPSLEKNLKEGSTQNIPELKSYFSKFEPIITVS